MKEKKFAIRILKMRIMYHVGEYHVITGLSYLKIRIPLVKMAMRSYNGIRVT